MSDVPSVLLLGVSAGLQAALLAVGLVLVYRASRFINFAQGQMGAIAAAVLAVLIFEVDAPYWIALPVALAVGALTGAAIERLLSWRLFEKSRLALLVATIGVAQLALLAILKGPLKVDASRLAIKGYPEPFHLRWRVGDVVLSSSQVTTIIIGPLIAVGLFLFLSRTRTGRAIRGAASNPDAARLAGVSVRRISLLVWVIAGLISALAAILAAPSQPSALLSGDAGLGLLLRGLAAALIAGMADFRIAFGAGIALGIAEQSTIFYTSSRGLPEVSVVAVLIVGLLLRARALGTDVRTDEALTVEASEPPIPQGIAVRFAVRHGGRIGWVVLLAIVAVAPLLPSLRSQERAVFLLFMVSFAMVGMSLTVLTGWAGQVSLGQFAFLGVGAFAAAYINRHDVGLPIMLLFAGAAGAVASAAVGAVAVRFRGLFLGVVTLGFAFVARAWLFRQLWLTRTSTDVVRVDDPHLLGMQIRSIRGAYVVGVVVLVLTVLALHSLRRSGVGRALIAVRDNDDLASAYGMPPMAVKLAGLAIAGFVTGVAGGLWGIAQGAWTFSAFDPTMSFVLLAVAIVGGIGTLYGPILGTIAVFAWPYLVPDANTLPIRTFTSGILVLITLLFFPGGLASLVKAARQWLIRKLEAGPGSRTGAVAERAQRAGTSEHRSEAEERSAMGRAAAPSPQPPKAAHDGVGGGAASERPGPATTPGAFPAVAEAQSLIVTDVSISFGGIRAVQDVSLHVDEGEIVGLIGGNGAGKSTLLNCVSGHVHPDAGRIVVSGHEVSDLAPEYRPFLGMSRTFQDARLFPGLTVLETVMVAMDYRNRSGAVGALVGAPWMRSAEADKRGRALGILESFGLEERAESLTAELSTGMRRICDLAALVASEPSLVLLDEPTAGLAQREVEEFAPLLRRLRDEHACSMLVVEHDMPLMMSLCDRIYCLEQGAVIAEGKPAAIRRDARVIASYLGTNAAAIRRSGGKGTTSRSRKKVMT